MAIRIFEMKNIGPKGASVYGDFRASQTGTVGASSVQSSAFGASTTMICVQSDEACHVVRGPNPTATTGGFKIAAGGTHEFAVTGGDKLAWIQA